MANISLTIQQISDLVEASTEFPVDFDDAWQWAGYAKKQTAKEKLKNTLIEGVDFLLKGIKSSQGGRSSEWIVMTVNAFEHFCLMANTAKGREVRQHFIGCRHALKSAVNRIRELELELQLAQAQSQKAIAEKSVLDTRHLIVSTCSEPVQQKILGYSTIETIEYRDRIVHNDELIRDGSTLSRSEVCRRLDIMKGKKPDCQKLDQLLAKLPSEATRLTASLQEYVEVKTEYLPALRDMWLNGDRQAYLGE